MPTSRPFNAAAASTAASSLFNAPGDTSNATAASNIIPITAAGRPGASTDVLLSDVLQMISQHIVDADPDPDHVRLSAARIERRLAILSGMPGAEPVLRATCQQLCEQWGALHEQYARKPASTTFITRLISGSRALRAT